MFRELNPVLGVSPEKVPDGKFVLISETSDVDGSFVIHHFINLYLKADHKVCVVALHQSFFHYYSVSMKLGTNLNTCREKGNLVFIDGLKLALEYQTNTDSDPSNNPYCSIMSNEMPSLETLFHFVENEFRKLNSNSGETSSILIVDDVSVLVNLGVPVKEIAKFVHCCKTLCLSSSPLSPPSCFLVLIHRGNRDDEDEENSVITTYFSHLSDIFVDVSGLKTGFSKDVHGQMTITQMDPFCSNGEMIRQKTHVQFKVEERNVRVFTPGSSTAVL